MSSELVSDQTPPPAKRRRIALACNSCRTRKSRCNGARPKCSTCTDHGLSCAYEATDHLTNDVVRKELVNGLEQRVEYLEKIVQRHEQLLNGTSIDENDDVSTYRGNEPPGTSSFPGQARNGNIQASRLEDVHNEGVVDGTAISFLDEQDSGYFGASSNISFMRHISRNLPLFGNQRAAFVPASSYQNLGQCENDVIHGSRRPYSDPDTTLCPSDTVSAYTLPPQAQLEDLLDSYFRKTGILFPFIHPASFMQEYGEIRDNNFMGLRRTWLGLLNMLMAMAVSTDDTGRLSALQRTEQSNVYYTRALALCNTRILRGSNLEIVQYLLLMGQYLQGTHNSVQTWNIHGLAVKAAFSLGLHSEHANSRFPPIEQEVRKRTWFGCILLDRSLCLTFGRPSSIPEHFVQVSEPIRWTAIDNLSAAANHHDKGDVSTVFLTAAVDLSKILHSIIAQLYNHNLGYALTLEDTELNVRVFQLEQELNGWQAFLNTRLRPMPADEPSGIVPPEDWAVTRCRNVLRLRYLHLEVLLYRPFIIKALDKQTNSSPQTPLPLSVSNMATKSIAKGVNSAEAIIIFVEAAICHNESGNSLLGAWWFTLFYVFNAALTVYAGILIDIGNRENTSGTGLWLRVSQACCNLKLATRALGAVDRENRIVQKCEEYLERLIQPLEQYSNILFDAGASEGGKVFQWPLIPEALDSSMVINEDTGLQAHEDDPLNFLDGDLELGQFLISGGF